MNHRGGFYQALGVAADASTETIRDAYRERVKEVHPDRSDAPDAAERFKRVTRAKEVLTDPQERARYDRLGHEAYVGRKFPSESSDGGDSTSSCSDSSGRETRRHRSERRRRRPRESRTGASRARGSRNAGPGRTRGGDQSAGGSTDRTTGRSTAGEPGGSPTGATRNGADGSTRRPGDGPESSRADGGATAAGHGRAGDQARDRRHSRRGRDRRETRGSRASRSTRRTAWRGHGSGTTGNRAGASGHAAEQYGRDWYTSGASSGTGYDVSPGGGTGLGPERVGLAAVAFVLYPLLSAGAFAPWFPPGINAAIGLLGLVLVGALLWTPEAGVLAFGGWTVLAPAVLVTAGVGVFSLTGVLVWSACWIPFLLSLFGLVFRHP